MINYIRKKIRKFINRLLGAYFTKHTKLQLHQIPAINKGIQILLMLKYQELLRHKEPLPKFEDLEFRSFSQNGEDGIRLYIFSLIGTTNKKAVEVCIGNGIESNTTNLIVNHGWEGLLFEANGKNVQTATEFYTKSKDTFIFPPKIVQAWVTAENVNDLISKNDFEGEIDFLSLDMDGMDYWILKTLEVVRPRVIMLEYHEEFGFESVTVPYQPQFDRTEKDMRYFGASLPAFAKLLKEKGYCLVGSNRQKFNGFFLRNDVGQGIFQEVSIESCLRQSSPQAYTLLKELKDYEFEQV